MTPKEIADKLISDSWVVCPLASEGEQYFQGTWVVGKWGCDSLDHLRDETETALDDAYRRGMKEAAEIARSFKPILSRQEQVARAIESSCRPVQRGGY